MTQTMVSQSSHGPCGPRTESELAVLSLVDSGSLSQSQAARLFGITRYDLLDRMGHHGLPLTGCSRQEQSDEREVLDRLRGFGSGHEETGRPGALLVVADAGPLIGLNRAGRLNVLPRLYGTPILIPGRVFDDVVVDGQGRRGARAVENAIARAWLLVKAVRGRAVVPASFRGMGEGEALALALETNADLLLMDDRAARGEAARLGLTCLTATGILLDARQMKVLTKLRPVLDRMEAKGFPVRDPCRLLQLVGEES